MENLSLPDKVFDHTDGADLVWDMADPSIGRCPFFPRKMAAGLGPHTSVIRAHDSRSGHYPHGSAPHGREKGFCVCPCKLYMDCGGADCLNRVVAVAWAGRTGMELLYCGLDRPGHHPLFSGPWDDGLGSRCRGRTICAAECYICRLGVAGCGRCNQICTAAHACFKRSVLGFIALSHLLVPAC